MNQCPTESVEQKLVIQWANMMSGLLPELALLHHIPNGGSRDEREAHNLRLQGVKSGVPDLSLPVPRGRYHGLYIEMKRKHGGTVSDTQREWLAALERQGYRCQVCKGAEEAIETIKVYLGKGE